MQNLSRNLLPLLIPLLCSAGVAQAAIVTVGSSGDYATITEAITAAATGDTIRVQPGTYPEAFVMFKKLTIEPDSVSGDVIIDGSGIASSYLHITTGTLRGLRIHGMAQVGVAASGDVRLEQVVIENSGSYGVYINGGTPVLIEVLTRNTGADGIAATHGTPTILRSIVMDTAGNGFDITSAGTYANLLALRTNYGFVLGGSVSVSQAVALESTTAGFRTTSTATLRNSVSSGNPLAIDCDNQADSVNWCDLYGSPSFVECAASVFGSSNLSADPGFVLYAAGADLDRLDLHLADSSPLRNAGTGADFDSSIADLGLFGGSNGVWTDADEDGAPIFFDCDDTDAEVFPSNLEIADGKDNDCDGAIDEDIPDDTGIDDTGNPPTPSDLDGDGYLSVASGGDDCDDHNIATHPTAPEIADHADNNCNGKIDEGTWLGDDDGDGVSEMDGDCDDKDPGRHPGAPDTDADGVDDDCDGIDDNAPATDNDHDGAKASKGDCDDSDPSVNPLVFDSIDGVDSDCDGVTDGDELGQDLDADGVNRLQGDCNEADRSIAATFTDIPDDFIDQDCNGTDLYDVDGDGNAAPKSGGTDCNDNRADIHPGADEVCDSYDNNCNGEIDEGCSTDTDTPDSVAEDTPSSSSGCSCGTGAGQNPSATGLLLLLAAWLNRRRTAARGSKNLATNVSHA
jgi:MYXO-CTERM domain-containing protein